MVLDTDLNCLNPQLLSQSPKKTNKKTLQVLDAERCKAKLGTPKLEPNLQIVVGCLELPFKSPAYIIV